MLVHVLVLFFRNYFTFYSTVESQGLYSVQYLTVLSEYILSPFLYVQYCPPYYTVSADTLTVRTVPLTVCAVPLGVRTVPLTVRTVPFNVRTVPLTVLLDNLHRDSTKL